MQRFRYCAYVAPEYEGDRAVCQRSPIAGLS